MNDAEQLRARLARVERRLRWLYAVLAVAGGAWIVTAAGGDGVQEVLRARGVVVVDDRGRERIVLGAPMGDVSADAKLSKAVGLAVKDSAGHLHVVAGAHNPAVLPGGKVIDRVAPGAGLTVYDPRNGMERGGFGVLADGRANVCLDYGTAPKEGACMSVGPEDSYSAFVLNAAPEFEGYDRATMFVGSDGAGSFKVYGSGANQSGVRIDAGEGRLPSITVYDSAGKTTDDLVRNR